ncbi:HalOD1 output domain-containing protein [Natrarchaeobaculum sulfurireducens]|uniref:HalOD1 output domain-containing protein n=1 Tax=Natrarchaeobaculum sulfurireducens TaxID=2044521 RepID=UPI00105AB054|nr:HalOD1 output domain-containing protein [Natrarchaeobaculum sulfurireducens]
MLTVIALSETAPDELDRIYDRIDPDSLESLFVPANAAAKRNADQVSFRLGGYTVTVHASRTIIVTGSA